MFLLIFANKKNKLILPIIASYMYTYLTIRYLVLYAYLIIKFVIHFPCSKSWELQLSHWNTFEVVQKYPMTMLDFQIGECQYNVGA